MMKTLALWLSRAKPSARDPGKGRHAPAGRRRRAAPAAAAPPAARAPADAACIWTGPPNQTLGEVPLFVPKIRGRAMPQHSAIVRHPKGGTSRNRRRTRLLTVDLTGRTCAAEPQPDTSPPPGPPPRRFSQVGLRLLRLRLAVTSLLRLRLPATRLLRLRLDIPPAPIPPPPNTRALARADAHACTHAPALGPSG